MDWQSFEDWCLGRYRKSPESVYYNLGRIRSLERRGLDLQAFLQDPETQERERNRIVAHLKRSRCSPNSLRSLQKSMNWLVDYAKHRDPGRAWARGELEPERLSEPKSVPLHLLESFWQCKPEDDYDIRLERALSWVAHHFRGRRSEIHALRDTDLHEKTSCIQKRDPAKRGTPGMIPVPTHFWDSGKPLQHYLEVRIHIPGSSALWRRRNARTGQPMVMGKAAVYKRLAAAERHVGHPLNFIRTRRSSSTHLDDAYNVHPRIGQFLLSHNSQESWMHYVGRVTLPRAVAHLQEIGVPGFEDHPLAPPRRKKRCECPGCPGYGTLLTPGQASFSVYTRP